MSGLPSPIVIGPPAPQRGCSQACAGIPCRARWLNPRHKRVHYRDVTWAGLLGEPSRQLVPTGLVLLVCEPRSELCQSNKAQASLIW